MFPGFSLGGGAGFDPSQFNSMSDFGFTPGFHSGMQSAILPGDQPDVMGMSKIPAWLQGLGGQGGMGGAMQLLGKLFNSGTRTPMLPGRPGSDPYMGTPGPRPSPHGGQGQNETTGAMANNGLDESRRRIYSGMPGPMPSFLSGLG